MLLGPSGVAWNKASCKNQPAGSRRDNSPGKETEFNGSFFALLERGDANASNLNRWSAWILTVRLRTILCRWDRGVLTQGNGDSPADSEGHELVLLPAVGTLDRRRAAPGSAAHRQNLHCPGFPGAALTTLTCSGRVIIIISDLPLQ
ncbi:hypothetical protein KUCAC02_015200 [Chaenocephalus aceratus]|uniref:Uncharacterized protein n=1 Tax=Chaenocephalus aceratus TaxID=36190 RepID=A0ACB9XYW3_CHAAC|nr:hypothetical protein KUCAC02_015200 [Chaenocephalus aceratus]